MYEIEKSNSVRVKDLDGYYDSIVDKYELHTVFGHENYAKNN